MIVKLFSLPLIASATRDLVAGDRNDAYDAFVHDRLTGITERVSVDSAGNQARVGTVISPPWPAISADGRYVVR